MFINAQFYCGFIRFHMFGAIIIKRLTVAPTKIILMPLFFFCYCTFLWVHGTFSVCVELKACLLFHFHLLNVWETRNRRESCLSWFVCLSGRIKPSLNCHWILLETGICMHIGMSHLLRIWVILFVNQISMQLNSQNHVIHIWPAAVSKLSFAYRIFASYLR